MLKSLELKNFKAFGERVKIPFAPITLIFGENSSGKSSILQSLNLLKQTLESKETETLLLPRTENGINDLGSFQDLLFDHDLKRNFVIKITMDFNSINEQYQSEIQKILYGYSVFANLEPKNIGIELQFFRKSLEEEVILDYIAIFLNEICIAKFACSERDILLSGWITNDIEIWKSRFEFCNENRRKILEFLQILLSAQEKYIKDIKKKTTKSKKISSKNTDSRGGVYFHDIQGTKDVDLSLKLDWEEIKENELLLKEEKTKNSIREAIEFYSTNFTIEGFVNRIRSQYVREFIKLEKFIPVSVLFESKSVLFESKEDEVSMEELYIRSLLKDSNLNIYKTKIFTPNFTKLAVIIGKMLEQTLQSVFPLGPFRKPPERWYIFNGSRPKDVGHKGDQLPNFLFRKHKLVGRINLWLKRLDVGYQIKIDSIGNKLKDLFEINLIDTKRNNPVEVSLTDVGFGISQLLPFIVQSLSSTDKIISIEQPEVHIHPRLQADLGDLLAETIKHPCGNRFIIETHSEHLILRLQKLVSLKELSPNDLSILYVSRGANGSKVQQLQLDEEGDFIDDWPGGFFPERLRELR